jgi:hypothetical protein
MQDDEYAELFKKLPKGSSSGTSWQDVAAEFENLGKNVADVLRNAWQRADGEADLGQLRTALHSALEDMNRAVDGSPETAQARDQLARLAESIRSAIERAGDEVRPELVNMLRQVNGELRRRANLDE